MRFFATFRITFLLDEMNWGGHKVRPYEVAAVGERLAAIEQGWREVWPSLVWVIAILAVATGIQALIFVHKMQVPTCPRGKKGCLQKLLR